MLLVGLVACGEGFAGVEPGGDGGQDATVDATTDTGTDSPIVNGCDTSKHPKDEPCLLEDERAVFVSPAGADNAAGTKGAPLKSIDAAIALAKPSRKVVIACEGTFEAKVTVDASKDGAILLGGFGCSDWKYEPAAKKTIVKPSAPGLALDVKSVTSLRIEDVAFEARDATAEGDSSIAAFVRESTGVVLRRVKLSADAGAAGAPGAVAQSGVADKTLDGITATNNNGAAEKTCTCTIGGAAAGTSKGGKGGTGGALGSDGGVTATNGDPGALAQASPSPPTATGAGGSAADCRLGFGQNVVGRPGSDAPTAADGPGATTAYGTLDANGWRPAAGQTGANGTPGQGGGGGGGGTPSGGGGGGACGGCGSGGGGGGGGGASVGLLLVNAGVELVASEISTKTGGAGGQGRAGAAGLPGGSRGAGAAAAGCNAGGGGTGGSGGAGGGRQRRDLGRHPLQGQGPGRRRADDVEHHGGHRRWSGSGRQARRQQRSCRDLCEAQGRRAAMRRGTLCHGPALRRDRAEGPMLLLSILPRGEGFFGPMLLEGTA
jgi:hypothetical protein